MARIAEVVSSPRARPIRHLPRTWTLRLVCSAANLAEATVALCLGVGGGAALAPQAAAPPPLGLFSDLRSLLVFERSWPTFCTGFVLLIAWRSGLSAVQVRLAWPGVPPPLGRVLARLVVFHVALALVLMPFALLLFGFAAFPISWLYFAAVPPAVVCSVLAAEGALAAGWWRHAPRATTVVSMLAAVALVTAAAGVVGLDPVALALPVAGLAGLVEAALWIRLVAGVAARPPGRFVPLAPALLLAFLGGAIGGAWAGFSGARPPRHVVPALAAGSIRGRHAVLVVGGFSSTSVGDSWRFTSLPHDVLVVPFSYRGSTVDGAPLPYGAAATHAAIPDLEVLMGRQVAALARRTGRYVDLVAVSEGSAVAAAYLSAQPDAPVAAAVFVSPLAYAGSVRYPAPGHDGWGMVAGRGLSLLGALLSPLSSQNLSPDQPFLRSLDAPAAPRSGASNVRLVEIVPLADAVAGPPAAPEGTITVVVAGFHGANLDDPGVQSVIGAAVAGRSVRSTRSSIALATVIANLAGAWRVPTLAAVTS